MAEPLKSRLHSDLIRARKDRDGARMRVLSTTLAELQNREIAQGRDASDEDVVAVLTRAIKQRNEAAEQMRAGGRADRAAQEEDEAALLRTYLPEGLGEDEVRGLVREAIAGGATQMGAVMALVMPRLKGRFDGREANRIVREELAR